MVGILLSSVIPLFLYVNEVNNYYDKTVINMKIADDERSIEDLVIYAFGHNQTGNAIDLFLINRGSVSLNITRIWITRTDLQKILVFTSMNLSQLPLQLTASSQATIGNVDLTSILEFDEMKDYFNIEVATERGKKYASLTNALHKTATGWETGTPDFRIQVIVLSDWGLDQYKIEVRGDDNGTSGFYDILESHQLHGDFFAVIPVPKAGSYNTTVWKWQGSSYDIKIGSSIVVLTWSHPSSLRRFEDVEL
jgi:hypothetical protein